MRRLLGPVVASAAVVIGVHSDAFGHAPGVLLHGSGTASIDGILSPGEWDRAARLSFQARSPANDGGGPVPVTLLEMNDGPNLYLALQIARSLTGSTGAGFDFDNAHDGGLDLGDDSSITNANPFFPPMLFDNYHLSPVSGGRFDASDGGTADGAVAVSGAGGTTIIETSHPVDSADDRHDFSLQPGARIGFRLFLRLWSLTPACNEGATCYADTWVPGPTATDFGDLVVEPDLIAPETTIDAGPLPGTRTRSRAVTFAFSGVDNLSPADKLTFACSRDGAPFTRCTSPIRYRGLRLGRHRFAVRATDELANIDATPAQRSWRILPRKKRGG